MKIFKQIFFIKFIISFQILHLCFGCCHGDKNWQISLDTDKEKRLLSAYNNESHLEQGAEHLHISSKSFSWFFFLLSSEVKGCRVPFSCQITWEIHLRKCSKDLPLVYITGYTKNSSHDCSLTQLCENHKECMDLYASQGTGCLMWECMFLSMYISVFVLSLGAE